MLGTDISLIEPPGFFLGKYHDLARLSGKWFEQLTKPLLQLSSTADWFLSGAGKRLNSPDGRSHLKCLPVGTNVVYSEESRPPLIGHDARCHRAEEAVFGIV